MADAKFIPDYFNCDISTLSQIPSKVILRLVDTHLRGETINHGQFGTVSPIGKFTRSARRPWSFRKGMASTKSGPFSDKCSVFDEFHFCERQNGCVKSMGLRQGS